MGPRTLAMLAALTITLSGCVAGGMELDAPPRHREITMWVEPMDWEVHPGVTTPVWAFCAEGDGVELIDGQSCSVPGPTVRVNEGDRITLHFENPHHIAHTVHFHGTHPFSADMTGNRILGDQSIADPGETETIEWIADPAGTFIYHCHFDTPTHMDMGMSGAFIVEPKGEVAPDHDFVAVLDEWAIGSDWIGNLPEYNYFTINGKSFPLTTPMIAKPGDSVRIRMVNAGYEFHAMHLHGYTPMSYEGVAGPENAVLTDVREIAPGQAVVLDIEDVQPGVWLFHDHVVPRVTAGSNGDSYGAYPSGMLTALIVGQEYVDAVVAAVPGLIEAAAAGGAAGHDDHDHAEPEPAETGTNPPVAMDMVNFAFAQETLTIEAGTKVVWRNKDNVVHTVTASDGGFDSGDIAGGKSWSHTFDAPGTYQYYCKPHAYQNDDGDWQGMVATIVVE